VQWRAGCIALRASNSNFNNVAQRHRLYFGSEIGFEEGKRCKSSIETAFTSVYSAYEPGSGVRRGARSAPKAANSRTEGMYRVIA